MLTNQNALEPDEEGWFVSSYTAPLTSCVQVRFTKQQTINIRDSKDAEGNSPILNMSSQGWASLLRVITLPS
jgi:hypothetical protein